MANSATATVVLGITKFLTGAKQTSKTGGELPKKPAGGEPGKDIRKDAPKAAPAKKDSSKGNIKKRGRGTGPKQA